MQLEITASGDMSHQEENNIILSIKIVEDI